MRKVGTISDKVQAVSEQLSDLQGEDAKLSNPFYLARWLRAKQLDVEQTVRAIRANRKWRRENGIDELASQLEQGQVCEIIKLPCFYDIRGKDGRPVIYTHAAGLIKQYRRRPEIVRQLLYHSVKIEKSVIDWNSEWTGSLDEMPGDLVDGAFHIVDCDGATPTSWLKAIPMTLEIIRDVTLNFPVSGRVGCCINASALIHLPLKLLQPVITSFGMTLSALPEEAKAEDWHREIFSVVTPEQLRLLQAEAKAVMLEQQQQQQQQRRG